MNCIINGITYKIKDGFIKTSELSENLDTMTVVIPFCERVNFEILDVCAFDSGEKMLISSVNSQRVNNVENIYNYTISLVSPTFILQKITLPSFSIRQNFKESEILQKTLLGELERILYVYTTPFSNGKIILSENLKTLIKNVKAPEFTFTKPTAWEFINTMLNVVNCICKANIDEFGNFVIDYVELLKKNNLINLSEFPFVNEFKNGNDFASESDITAENLISDENSLTKSFFRVSPRSEEALITSDNAKIILPSNMPIYKIDKVYAELKIFATGLGDTMFKLDLTPYIYEKTEYDVLPNRLLPAEEVKQWRSAYYTQYGNEIDGFTVKKGVGNAFDKIVQDAVINNRIYPQGPFIIETTAGNINFQETLFTVIYYSKTDTKFRASKKVKTKNKAYSFDDQSESLMDTKGLGIKTYQNINRFGNSELILSGRFPIERINSFNLGDYTGDYVVIKKETAIYDDFFNVKLTLNSHFANKNYYAGLKREKRITSLIQAKDAILRHDLLKSYAMFGFTENEIDPNLSKDYYINLDPIQYASFILKTLQITVADVDSPRFLAVETYDSLGNIIQRFIIAFSRKLIGSSIIFDFCCESNVHVGKKIEEKNSTGGDLQGYVKYVDTNGEFKKIKMILSCSAKVFDKDIFQSFENQLNYFEYVKDTYANEYPSLAGYEPINKVFEVSKILNKGNADITSISFQTEFLNSQDIFIGDRFITENVLMREKDLPLQELRVYYSTVEGEKYDVINNDKCLGDNYLPFSSISILNNQITIIGLPQNVISWGIGNYDRDLFVGVNSNKNIIYLNIFSERR